MRHIRLNWLALPDSVQAHILQLLPLAALRRARLACKAWARLVPGPALAAKQHLTLGGPLVDKDEEVAAILARCPRLTSVTLLQPTSCATLACLAALQPGLTKLVCCVTNEPSCCAQLAAVMALTSLRSLSVHCLIVDWHNNNWQLDVAALTNLASLRLLAVTQGVRLSGIERARGLTELQLREGPIMGFDVEASSRLVKALAPLTGLVSLRLAGSYFADKRSLAWLSRLTALTHLEVPPELNGAWLSEALAPLTGLANLCAYDAGVAEDEEVQEALAGLPGMTWLHLHLSVDDGFQSLTQWLAPLTRLSELSLALKFALPDVLGGMPGLTALTVIELAREWEADPLRATLAHVTAATQLRHLGLRLAHRGQRNRLPPLPLLPWLTELNLADSRSPVAAWLPALATQLPRLRRLALPPCHEGNAPLSAHLAACTALTQLRLVCQCQMRYGTPVRRCLDAAELACLPSLPQLAELVLSEVNEGYPAPHPRGFTCHVARSASLRRLLLIDAPAGDLDCAQLASSCSLERITLRDDWDTARDSAGPCRPPCDSPGLAALLAAGCQVVYEDYEPAN